MFKKILKFFGYFVLFIFGIGILGAFFGDENKSTGKDKKKINTQQVSEIPEKLHQKQVFSTFEKYYKGKIYSTKEANKWIFVKFLVQGDSLNYGDNYSNIAKYIGSTDNGYDVYKSSRINNDFMAGEDHFKFTSYNVIYFNKSTKEVQWKMVTENSINDDNGIKIFNGTVYSTNGY